VTYFEDLTEYSYYGPDIVSRGGGYVRFEPRYRRLAVGWLDAPHPVPTGEVPAWVPEKLLDVLAGPQVNVMRGFHLCTFCDGGRSMLTVRRNDTSVSMGHAEIRVPGDPGLMFAAPTLIWHYVTAHQYRPPQPFLDALATYDPAWLTDPASPWIPPDADREN
jgi:hypothetical protein